MADAGQRDNPAEPVDWDVLPNGLIEVQYDRTGDGVPDYVDLHQIAWSGWTAQPLREIEAQAHADGQWGFIVQYDQDLYVYLTRAEPLFVGNDTQQDGGWVAVPTDSQREAVGHGCLGCALTTEKGGACHRERC